MFGRPRLLPYPPTPATTPCATRWVSGWSTAPNRSWSMTAMGRAPMEMMSRTIPPTPVAAPWCAREGVVAAGAVRLGRVGGAGHSVTHAAAAGVLAHPAEDFGGHLRGGLCAQRGGVPLVGCVGAGLTGEDGGWIVLSF